MAGFRGGPTFPAMYLGTAAGIMASHLPGYALTPAVAVGMGAGVAAILRLPLSAVALAAVLTAGTGAGSTPLIIVGVVTAYVATAALPATRPTAESHSRSRMSGPARRSVHPSRRAENQRCLPPISRAGTPLRMHSIRCWVTPQAATVMVHRLGRMTSRVCGSTERESRLLALLLDAGVHGRRFAVARPPALTQ